jgi:hypothetical protein
MSTAAAAAAAAHRARREEESMTGYTPAELAEGWEFKILRCSTSAFRDPARMKDALDQEARAGWELLEKFDNQRLRLKRPASAKAKDNGLDFDPYRTTYGISDAKLAAIILTSVFGGLGLVLFTVFLIAHKAPAHP